jgi:hypothetical protein
MHLFRSSFPRLRDQIRYEEHGERLESIRMCICLYNYHTNLVGCNQICNVFASSLEAQADNLHTMFNLNDYYVIQLSVDFIIYTPDTV